MEFSVGQLEKLSEFTLDISKAFIISAMAIPLVISNVELLTSIRSIVVSFVFLSISLYITKMKENLV